MSAHAYYVVEEGRPVATGPTVRIRIAQHQESETALEKFLRRNWGSGAVSGIGPGDVVVCVAGCCGGFHRSPSRRIVVGRYYTVVDIQRDDSWTCIGGLHLREVQSESGNGFCMARFRKIDRADDASTRQVRACRPIRKREDA